MVNRLASFRSILPFVVLLGSIGCSSVPEDDWPQWRGPGGLGLAPADVRLPVAWSADSPNIRWKTDLPGIGNSSPIATGGRVYLTTAYRDEAAPQQMWRAVVVVLDRELVAAHPPRPEEGDDPGWMAAYDKKSGAEVWRIEWETSCCSYTTPLVVERGSGEEILFVHAGMVVGYDAATGESLWHHELPINQPVASPVIDGDLLAVSSGAHGVKHTVFLRLAGSGRETKSEVVWEQPRYVPETSSPVLYEGRFYTVTDRGVLVCYDAASGDILWRKRLERRANRASLLAGDGKVYLSGSSGWVTVVAAAPKFRQLAQNHLDEVSNNASLAIAGGCLLLRTKEHLVCIATEREPA